MRRRRAWLEFRRQLVIQRVDRDEDLNQVALGHGREDVDIAFDQRVLGDDGARVVALIQQRQRGTGEAPAFFDRLVGVGVAADVDRLAGVVLLGQLVAEDVGEVGLGEQLRLEVQAG